MLKVQNVLKQALWWITIFFKNTYIMVHKKRDNLTLFNSGGTYLNNFDGIEERKGKSCKYWDNQSSCVFLLRIDIELK